MPTPHPTDFFIIHIWYEGYGHGWGNLSEKPILNQAEAESQLQDAMRDSFHGASLETVKVWRFQSDVPARDVTEDVLRSIGARLSREYWNEPAADFPREWLAWAHPEIQAQAATAYARANRSAA